MKPQKPWLAPCTLFLMLIGVFLLMPMTERLSASLFSTLEDMTAEACLTRLRLLQKAADQWNVYHPRRDELPVLASGSSFLAFIPGKIEISCPALLQSAPVPATDPAAVVSSPVVVDYRFERQGDALVVICKRHGDISRAASRAASAEAQRRANRGGFDDFLDAAQVLVLVLGVCGAVFLFWKFLARSPRAPK
jgi:hypothetical protein